MNKWQTNSLILIFFVYNIQAQNFRYVPEDWYIITKPGSVNAITEDNFHLYFATDYGVYRYDKGSEDFQYDYSFSVKLKFPQINHFYFDSFRDYFWVVHQTGVSYRSSVSSIWREMSLMNSGIYSYSEIDDIGSSPRYLWIRSGDELYPFDGYSAVSADWKDAKDEVDFIRWGHSHEGISGNNFEISQYIMDGDWLVGARTLSHKDGRELNVIVFMEDNDGNKWFGTDQGYILKGTQYSSKINLITIGLPFSHVTEAYLDNEGHWWFADNHYKRTGKILSFDDLYHSQHNPFISQWNERENRWIYYFPDESIEIAHTDINSILQIGSTMYFGTMHGLLYLDLYNKNWDLIDETDGLNDSAVWDILEYDGSVFLATANGLNEISIVNHSIIPDKYKKFADLISSNIYEIKADSQYLYIASDAGLLQMHWDTREINTLSKKHFARIHIKQNLIWGTDGTLWEINDIDDEKHIISEVYDFDICGTYIWSIKSNKAILLNSETDQTWVYNSEDGIPGNKLYGINCDSEWVWFLTNNGVAFYNWSKYHNQNN